MLEMHYVDVFKDALETDAVEAVLKKKKTVRDNIFLLPQYLKAVAWTYGYRCHYLLAKSRGRIQGLAAFIVVPRPLIKNRLLSVPGGFWAEDIETEAYLLEELNNIAARERASRPFLMDLFSPCLHLTPSHVLHRVVKEMPEREADLLSGYSSNLRRKIRKAGRNRLRLVENRDIREFYGIWAARMRELGTPVIPVEFLLNMKTCLHDRMTLLCVRREEEILGGCVLVSFGRTTFMLHAGALKPYFSLYPNNLLYHGMFLYAMKKGRRRFDMGRSQPNSGNERFKLQFGGELAPLYSYNFQGGGDNPTARRMFAGIWREMPPGLANSLGPTIRRYIPYG